MKKINKVFYTPMRLGSEIYHTYIFLNSKLESISFHKYVNLHRDIEQ